MTKTIKVTRIHPRQPGRSGWWWIIGGRGKVIQGGMLCIEAVRWLFTVPRGNEAEFVVSTRRPRHDDYHTFIKIRNHCGVRWKNTETTGYSPVLMGRPSAYLTRQFRGVNTLYITMYGD